MGKSSNKKSSTNSENNSKKNKKGYGKLIAILSPILIFVLIVGSFFAIINGVIEIIMKVLDAIEGFFDDLASGEIGREISNWIGFTYKPPDDGTYLSVLTKDAAENLKEQIESQIDTTKARIIRCYNKKDVTYIQFYNFNN